MGILSWIVFGLIVGAVARLVMPGRQNVGLFLTILLGVGGSFAGGALYGALRWERCGHATQRLDYVHCWSPLGIVRLWSFG